MLPDAGFYFSAIVVRPVVPRLLYARATQTAIDGNWVRIRLSASLSCLNEPAMLTRRKRMTRFYRKKRIQVGGGK